MPAPLLVPRVPRVFPPLAATGGQIAHPSSQTTPGIEAVSLTVSTGDQTAPRIEAGGPTAPSEMVKPPTGQRLTVRPPGPSQ
jgi:hypothetical protein